MLTNIANYKIVRRIGAGGMGEVFEGMQEQIQRRAAIKVLHAAFAENQEVVHRFLNEARAVNIIGHPSLVNIYEFGQAQDGSPYIVMEFLEGETLRQRLTRVGRISPHQAMNMARQIASALAAAHTKQIVHRDLKPVNIMIVADPDMEDGERIKVLDFGIAKLAAEVGSEALTRTGSSMGTPRYMSPEQCKSARDVTDRSDVYTLGLILYEMLSGESPYADVKAEIMLMGAQIGQPAPPLADKGTLASPELCALTHRMLDKNPEVRPTAAEVATMLKRMTAGPPSQPVPIVPEAARADTAEGTVKSSASESPGKRPTGGPYLIGAATVALFLGLIGLLLVLRSSLRPVQPPPKPVFIHFRIVSEPTLAELFDESGTLIGHTPFENSQPRAQRSLTFTVHKNNFADRRVAVDLESDSENNVALDPIPPPPPLITPVTEKAAASKRKNPRKR